MTINFQADNLVCNTINGSAPLLSPATTKGDLLVDDGTALQRLGVGANAFVLTADSTQTLGVKWAAVPAGFTNPMTTAGDIITGGSGGTAQRLGIGTAGFVLTSVSGTPAWAVAFVNPMSTKGDLIAGGAAGAATRLPVGADALVLVADSTQTLGVKWAAATPLTTKGDVLTFGSAPDRLAVGTNGQVLTADSTQTDGIKWATPTAGFANPMTTSGDLITGGVAGAAGRLAIGTTGQILTVISGAPGWSTSTAALVGSANTFTKAQVVSPVINNTATGTVTPDLSASNNFRYVLTGNLTIGTPTNPADGGVYNFRLKQDGTGTRIITWPSAFKFPGGVAPVLSTAAGAVDFLSTYYDATDAVYECNLNKAFA